MRECGPRKDLDVYITASGIVCQDNCRKVFTPSRMTHADSGLRPCLSLGSCYTVSPPSRYNNLPSPSSFTICGVQERLCFQVPNFHFKVTFYFCFMSCKKALYLSSRKYFESSVFKRFSCESVASLKNTLFQNR